MMAAEIIAPLEKRERISKTSKKKQPCLHPQWTYPIQCIMYEPLDSTMNCADLAEWQERLQFIVNDCRELLRLEYSMFWCQVIFEPTIIPSINSYLKTAPRPHDIEPVEIPSECSDLHDELHRLVFLILLRMSTYKESKTDFMTKEVFGDIIYTHYIFDITKLLDICCLYGHANQTLVTKMIENIFQCQAKYKSDLIDWFGIMKKIFEKLRFDSKFVPTTGSPQKLGQSTEHLTPGELIDRLLYLADAISSLDAFMHVGSFLCRDFLNNGFEQQIAHLYEDLVPHFQEEIRKCNFKNDSDRQLCRRALKRFTEGSLSVYRKIVFPVCLGPLVETEPEKGQPLVELFTNISLNILGYRRFQIALEQRYPFGEDLDFIRQSGFGSCIDDAQISFILEAVKASKTDSSSQRKGTSARLLATSKDKTRKWDYLNIQRDEREGLLYNDDPGCPAPTNTNGRASPQGACAANPDLSILLSTVQDILPDLGAGFIEACLIHYDYSSEKVINALLEGSLPANLDKLDRSLPLAINDAQGETAVRHSIYDGDEFDHTTGEKLDMSRIHQGKRNKESSLAATDIQKIVEHYDQIAEWEDVPGNEECEYDDEYDDTYESHLSSTVEDAKDAVLYGRPWVLPSALRGGKASDDSPAGELSSDDTGVSANKDKEEARIDSTRGQKEEREHGGRSNPDQSDKNLNSDNRKTYDVRGQAKGKGQTAEVTRNRQFKDRHKARGANHNRRVLADKKRQKTGFY